MVVLRGIIGVAMPPAVSMARVSGVTSRRSTSLTSPLRTPPWMAAPMATTSSGFTPRCGSRPMRFLAVSMTLGMRVMPPTRTSSLTSLLPSFASFKHASTGLIVRVKRSSVSCSSFERVSFFWMCFGPEASAVTKGRLISYSCAEERAIFAFSASSLMRCTASGCLERSMPESALNSEMIQSMIL